MHGSGCGAGLEGEDSVTEPTAVLVALGSSWLRQSLGLGSPGKGCSVLEPCVHGECWSRVTPMGPSAWQE